MVSNQDTYNFIYILQLEVLQPWLSPLEALIED